jgi:hypothetical protein
MKHQFIEDEITYTGEQLRSNFAYRHFGIIGDSIIGFCGGCHVTSKEMVDIEDVASGSSIYSESMLHFIIEHFQADIEKAILRQLLLANIVQVQINDLKKGCLTKRIGSDLYDDDAKLSISVATVTPISSLIHFGINISSANTPVKTKGLRDYDIEPRGFALSVMERYVREYDEIQRARCKVRWVL